jgi:hypothetical protein
MTTWSYTGLSSKAEGRKLSVRKWKAEILKVRVVKVAHRSEAKVCSINWEMKGRLDAKEREGICTGWRRGKVESRKASTMLKWMWIEAKKFKLRSYDREVLFRIQNCWGNTVGALKHMVRCIKLSVGLSTTSWRHIEGVQIQLNTKHRWIVSFTDQPRKSVWTS